jgi:hypothetical protein
VPAVRSGQFLHVFLDGDSQKGMGMFAPAAGSGQK